MISKLIEELKQILEEGMKPYVFMLDGELDYSRLRSAVEFDFRVRNNYDTSLLLTIDKKAKEITVIYKGLTDRELAFALLDPFNIKSERFGKVPKDHVNNPKDIAASRKALDIATRRYSAPDEAIDYAVDKILDKHGELYKAVPEEYRQKLRDYLFFEDAWKQEKYEIEILKEEPPWVLWQSRLVIPFEIGSFYSYLFDTPEYEKIRSEFIL